MPLYEGTSLLFSVGLECVSTHDTNAENKMIKVKIFFIDIYFDEANLIKIFLKKEEFEDACMKSKHTV